MKKIYMCSMVVGDEKKNAEKAKEYAKYIALKCGAIPVAPQIYFPTFLDGDSRTEAKFRIEVSEQLLLECDEFWYFGDGVTMDMVNAILKAREMNIPVRHVSDREVQYHAKNE